MEFEWDEAKAARSLEKQSVRYEVVYEIDWTDAVAREDMRRDYGELRLRTLIVGPGGERYVIVFTPRHGRHRIISIRHAHLKEYERWQRL
jgi:uncharacterized DUF497 family protein